MSWNLRRLPGRERTEVDKDEQFTNQEPLRKKRKVKKTRAPVATTPEKQLSVRELRQTAEPPQWQNLQLIQPPQPIEPPRMVSLQPRPITIPPQPPEPRYSNPRPAPPFQPVINETLSFYRGHSTTQPAPGIDLWINQDPGEEPQLISQSQFPGITMAHPLYWDDHSPVSFMRYRPNEPPRVDENGLIEVVYPHNPYFSCPFDPHDPDEAPPGMSQEERWRLLDQEDNEYLIWQEMEENYNRLRREEDERRQREGDNFRPRYSFREVNGILF